MLYSPLILSFNRLHGRPGACPSVLHNFPPAAPGQRAPVLPCCRSHTGHRRHPARNQQHRAYHRCGRHHQHRFALPHRLVEKHSAPLPFWLFPALRSMARAADEIKVRGQSLFFQNGGHHHSRLGGCGAEHKSCLLQAAQHLCRTGVGRTLMAALFAVTLPIELGGLLDFCRVRKCSPNSCGAAAPDSAAGSHG